MQVVDGLSTIAGVRLNNTVLSPKKRGGESMRKKRYWRPNLKELAEFHQSTERRYFFWNSLEFQVFYSHAKINSPFSCFEHEESQCKIQIPGERGLLSETAVYFGV